MKDYGRMDYPRIQEIPGAYGKTRIEGVVIRDLPVYSDERGFLMEMVRLDDKEVNAPDIKQLIASYSYPGVVKGWHLHSRQEDHLVCVTGMVKLALYDFREDSPTYQTLNEIYLGERHPRSVFIPPGIFHGIKNIGREIAVVIGMPSLFYDPKNVDERRVNPMRNDIIPYDWGINME